MGIYFFSLARKEILIKVVAMALLTYTMSCFKLSINVFQYMNRMIAHFFMYACVGWGHKLKCGMHWAKWDKVAQPNKFCGLCFKDFIYFNLAMLVKISW